MKSNLPAVTLYATMVLLSRADVTVKQGNASVQEFASPMVVTMPFPNADRSTWGRGPTRNSDTTSLRDMFCDGVAVVDFNVASRQLRGGKLRHTFTALFINRPGIDKRAILKIELLRGETNVATSGTGWVKVEEGKSGFGRTEFLTSEQEIEGTTPPTLRLTLRVRDDP
ncbi:MAG TPA: hypothetical protein VFQ06_04825 [Nitrospira sp.]|nr:hypothetical protein [Nitrospira sp.]